MMRVTFLPTLRILQWPNGWAFMLSWLSPIWVVGAFDSCVHMSEEAANATRAVPYGILMSVGLCWVIGLILVIVITGCMNPDLGSILKSPFGQPMAQVFEATKLLLLTSKRKLTLTRKIYYDALGKKGTLFMMSLLFIVQFLMGLSTLVAASRQTWAFSRDGALPFSRFFRPISRKFGYIPLRTIWGSVLVASILGLLSLIAPVAAQALFSLAIAGNYVAWGIPIFARVMWGQHKFKPGLFYTGDRFSVPIAWTAVVFLTFGIILSMFPVGGPNPTRKSSSCLIALLSDPHR